MSAVSTFAAAAAASPLESNASSIPEIATSPLEKLVYYYSQCWNEIYERFDISEPFDLVSYIEMLNDFTREFRKEGINYDKHFGYIEKFDLDPSTNPEFFIRADLHGDLKSLLENLIHLKNEGYLDSSFTCKPGKHIVFLGDYCDREFYGTQVLEILLRLKQQSPEQVHLIRGNHEEVLLNENSFKDRNLFELIRGGRSSLTAFYETMPLAIYFCVDKPNGNREYIMCTHALFEVTVDTSVFLDDAASGAYMPIPRKRKLSDRIIALALNEYYVHLYALAAKRICEIAEEFSETLKYNSENEIVTAYNWADVAASLDEETHIGNLGRRTFRMGHQDIYSAMELMSVTNRVCLIFRGHQHHFKEHVLDGKVFISTLPVGSNCRGYRNGVDVGYMITTSASGNLEDWTKSATVRYTSENRSVQRPPRNLFFDESSVEYSVIDGSEKVRHLPQ